MSVLDELRRERLMRDRVYPHMIASRKITQVKADHANRGLDGAIATLERLVAAQAAGEPGRKELIAVLRKCADEMGASFARNEALELLDKVPT